MDTPKKGIYQWLEFTCDDKMLQDIIPLLAEMNDKFEADGIPNMVLLYPSQKGNRVVVIKPNSEEKGR